MEPNDTNPARVPLDKCGLARALALIGDRWTLLILREAFYGVRRFEEMRADIGAPRTVLSERLASLVESGLMEREPYQERGQRTRFEYRLTAKGADLLPALIALMQWGDRHLGDGEPPLDLRHADCGASVRAALVCERGHLLTHPRELSR